MEMEMEMEETTPTINNQLDPKRYGVSVNGTEESKSPVIECPCQTRKLIAM
jgi:hypothetical protein